MKNQKKMKKDKNLSEEISQKKTEIPSFEKQVESCLKAGREGNLIKWDGSNLKNE